MTSARMWEVMSQFHEKILENNISLVTKPLTTSTTEQPREEEEEEMDINEIIDRSRDFKCK